MIGLECIRYGNSEGHEIFVHTIGGGGHESRDNNGILVDSVYYDSYDLVITNYMNKSMTVKEFVDIAQKFVDTAKSDRPIGDILFLGQAPGDCMPYQAYNEKVYEKYSIIEIGFEARNSAKEETLKELSYVVFYKNGKHSNEFTYLNAPKIKDSVLNSSELIDSW